MLSNMLYIQFAKHAMHRVVSPDTHTKGLPVTHTVDSTVTHTKDMLHSTFNCYIYIYAHTYQIPLPHVN